MSAEAYELREIAYGSEDYKTTLELRHRILRQPIGLNLWHENLSVEVDQRHFTLWQQAASLVDAAQQYPDQHPQRRHKNGLLVCLAACLVIVPQQHDCVKLRQMAVDSRYQRQGLGQRLIAAVEDVLRKEGVQRIELHARETAVAFYQACGYQRAGPAFLEVGLPHQCMTKILQSNVRTTDIGDTV